MIVLVIGGAVEEVLPKFFGVGFPVLLSVSLFVGQRRTPLAGALFALAAGGMTDALASLPPMTSSGFFLLVSMAMRRFPFPRTAMLAVYPLYQVWLALWVSSIGAAVYMRILVSIPIGCLTAAAACAAVSWFERKAAVDEAD